MTEGLNEVRSWRPEQCINTSKATRAKINVSMKSGLGDRNNRAVVIVSQADPGASQ